MISFERNRYFYGKLLTAADFSSEQGYFNKKRALINRMLFGCGVVSGFSVIKADDMNIIIDSGLALDSDGREILNSQPLSLKVSSLSGYEQLEKNDNSGLGCVYLCAAYKEELFESVHNVASSVDSAGEGEYNKIRETCEFFLTEAEPEIHPLLSFSETQNYLLLFSGAGIRIYVTFPKYAKSDDTFFIKTYIENSLDNSVSFKYAVNLSFLSKKDDERTSFVVSFGEETQSSSKEIGKQIVSTEIFAFSGKNVTIGEISIGEFELKINGLKAKTKSSFKTFSVRISNFPEKDFINEYREKTFEERISSHPCLYIARIYMIATSDYCFIDKVENLPFEQIILPPSFTSEIEFFKKEDLKNNNNNTFETALTKVNMPIQKECSLKSSSGIVKVFIPENSSKGDIFYSIPTAHELGMGSVSMTCGLCDDYNMTFGFFPSNDLIVFGISLDTSQGVFKIGVKLLKKISRQTTFEFFWSAQKDVDKAAIQPQNIILRPDVVYTAPYQTTAFEISRGGKALNPCEFEWSLNPLELGKISKNGVFASGPQSGLCEIKVKSLKDPEVFAAAFVVIEDSGDNKENL